MKYLALVLFVSVIAVAARAQTATESIDVQTGETLTVSQEVLYDRITLREGSTLRIINDGRVTANTLASLGTQENPVTISISKPATRDTMSPSFADEYAGIFLRRGSNMTFTNITADAQVAIVSHESLTMRDCTFVMPNQSQENYGQEQLAIVIQRIFTAERTTFGPCFASNWSERFSNGANTSSGSQFSLITLFGNVSTRPTRMTLRDCVIRDIVGDRGERGPNGTTGDPGEDAPDAIIGNGITGDPGFPGNPGGTGDHGGSVTIINSEYTDRILVVNTVFDNIQGGDGGQGGNGGRGGVGGQGGDGADAVIGDGARGGRGGQGGQGGRAGNGGDGGDVVILRTSRHESPLVMTNVTMTSISPGRVGFDGLRGAGGPGGPGGAGGAGGAFGGETGDAGSPGSTGPPGDLAPGGDEGSSYAVFAENFFLSGDPVSSPEVTLSNSIISFADRGTNTVLSAEPFAGPLAAERLLVFRQTRVAEGNASSSDVTTGNPLLTNPGSGAASDYTPLPGSPAIDAGSNLLVTPGIETDLVGNARFLDDPNTANTGIGETPEDVFIVDIGAVEAPGDAPFCAPDIDGSGLLDFGDVSAFLTAFAIGDLAVDFDESGALDFGDVSTFLALFASGCP